MTTEYFLYKMLIHLVFISHFQTFMWSQARRMELQGSFGSNFLWCLNPKVFIFSKILVFVLPHPLFFLAFYCETGLH